MWFGAFNQLKDNYKACAREETLVLECNKIMGRQNGEFHIRRVSLLATYLISKHLIRVKNELFASLWARRLLEHQ